MSDATGHEMPFLDHLEELRHRLFWIAAALAIGVVLAFVLLSKLDIIRLLERPILPLLHGQKLIYTHPGTSFHILLNASLVLGIILASPVVVGQLWGFLAPALYAHEKKVVVPVLVSMVALFLAGVALSYFVVLPLTLRFLMSIESTALTPMISATEYFDFAISMCLAFGAVFEVPIAILALTALGLITPKFLSRYRRHAVIVCLTAAAFITPGADPYSLFALAVPLYLLYELSVAVAFVVVRRREKRELKREQEERAEREAELRQAEPSPAGLRRLMTLIVAAAIAVAPPMLTAQVTPPPVTPRGGQQLRPDTTRRDTTVRDSTKRDLIKWNETDSVMEALMRREGYTATRYQGAQAIFNAQTRTLELQGSPAGVNRAQTVLVGDSITYSDSTKIIVARGDTVILRDPEQQAADVIARGQMAYNVELHRGVVTNIATQIAETGQNWFVGGRTAAFVSDTSRGKETAFYVRNGTITSCDDSIPDYHFRANEIKMVSKHIMVARPAVLYIGDVPIMWLPFIFQDMRSGRRSGVLTPRFGLSEVFRNSPSYRRHLENLGYYFALSDYMDAQVALDWRSGSRPSEGDPGWIQYNGELQYRWLDRFVTGRFAASYHAQRDGTSNTSVSWFHNQDFSQNTRFHADVNYVTNTTLQRSTTFNAAQVLASIRSNASYDTKLGPASMSLGFSNSQHPGRSQVDRDFPVLSISSPAIAVTNWLDWTPSFNFRTSESLNQDQAGEFTHRYFVNPQGLPDSSAIKRNSRQTTSGFSTPIRIGGFTWSNTFTMSDNEVDAPQTWVIRDPNDSSIRTSKVFEKSFNTNVDWQTSFSLPSFLNGNLHLTPSLNFSNVDAGNGFWVRSHLSNGVFVHQSKRPSFSLSSAPTLFALFPGFGSVTRFRHSITPTLSYSYSPTGHLSDEFLRATNRTREGFLGALAQNSLTLGLSHVLEAKLKNDDTTSTAEPKKIKVLSMDFTGVTYDFERARKTHRSGFSTSTFGTNIATDLIPGFRGNINWSLYQGDVLSDTARFKPFRTDMGASLTLNGQSGIFGIITRLFGRAVPVQHPQIESTSPTPQDALANRVATTPVAGITSRQRQFSVPADQGWTLSLTYTQSRQRPPVGNGIVIDQNTFEQQCAPVQANPISYQTCLDQAAAQAANATLQPGTGISGAPFVRVPNRDNLASSLNFHLTPNWAGTWTTNYDFEAGKFGSHVVSLQRQLHDWRAIFAFTQAPNGNFAFNFFIALNAEPDLKFNYDRATYRPVAR
ncbi:MAG TPA: twin-arginine translocase subunit TatC [Gemmatimonadaceae bacterium]|nr:twin-arginine translocase subunit TatC [Gemmatimonadaceae bacterium]